MNHLTLTIKAAGEAGEFEGYGSVYGVRDHADEVIEHGAFKDSIQKKKTFPLLWSHQPNEPIGLLHSVSEDMHGLKVKGTINLETQRGKEAYSLLKQGSVTGLSVGFSVPNETKAQSWSGKGRTIHKAELFEISLVAIPMNDAARITQVKSDSDHVSLEQLRDLLSDLVR